LSPDLHKGQAGRIGVVGGSKECVPDPPSPRPCPRSSLTPLALASRSYSGAPYFASMTTLRIVRPTAPLKPRSLTLYPAS